MNKPETVADVLAEMKQQTRDGWTTDARLCRFANRIERAMAASAVPYRWLVGDEAFHSEAEAIEAIRQWGPSDAIATPVYAHAPPAVPSAVNSRLYHAVNLMMAVVCSEGEIRNRTKETEAVMAALAEIDGGTYAPAVPVEAQPASVSDGYPLSKSEAAILIEHHEFWIAEAESIGAEFSGNERKLELLRAIATTPEESP